MRDNVLHIELCSEAVRAVSEDLYSGVGKPAVVWQSAAANSSKPPTVTQVAIDTDCDS